MSKAEIQAELQKCRSDPTRFNATILGRTYEEDDGSTAPAWYWDRQVEIADSVVTYPTTCVPAGNGVGKSFLAAGLLHWFLVEHPGCMVLVTAPSQTQLEEVLWKQVEKAHQGSRIPLGGRLLKDPLKVDMGGDWFALGYSTTKTERLSGHHRKDILAIIDEASGVEAPIFEAIDSCNPSRLLLLGNPLRPDGPFYERCTQAEAQNAEPDRLANLIRVSSLESPDIGRVRSPRGMADATWLQKARNDYGEGSIWWLSHVLALFPDSASDSVIPRDWLDRAGRAEHFPFGKRRTAIDLAEGNGGDKSVVLTRDDNGILDLEHSNRWSLEETARKAALQARRFRVESHRITFDVAGLGADFANRLAHEGLEGCKPYRGGNDGGTKFGNLRGAAAWRLRQRLDPARMTEESGLWIPQTPFAIRPDWLKLFRPELQGLRYTQDAKGRICLEPKELLAKRLKHSPDFADVLGQSFAYPNS